MVARICCFGRLCEHAVRGHGPREWAHVSEEAYKCSLRFLQLRLALAGAVLDEEASAQAAGRRDAQRNTVNRVREVPRLSAEEEEVAEVLRGSAPLLPAANHHTHTILRNKLTETAEDALQRRQAVLQRLADMGFGGNGVRSMLKFSGQ